MSSSLAPLWLWTGLQGAPKSPSCRRTASPATGRAGIATRPLPAAGCPRPAFKAPRLPRSRGGQREYINRRGGGRQLHQQCKGPAAPVWVEMGVIVFLLSSCSRSPSLSALVRSRSRRKISSSQAKTFDQAALIPRGRRWRARRGRWARDGANDEGQHLHELRGDTCNQTLVCRAIGKANASHAPIYVRTTSIH
jgi:hypothetical protein